MNYRWRRGTRRDEGSKEGKKEVSLTIRRKELADWLTGRPDITAGLQSACLPLQALTRLRNRSNDMPGRDSYDP